MSGYEWSTHVEHNIVGGGHFDVVRLWYDGKPVQRWTYDGTLAAWLSRRRRDKKIEQLRTLYGAMPRPPR